MRCKRLDDLLPGYLDGVLPQRLNQQVSDHLDACERCRQELAVQQRALRSLDAARRTISIDLWADFSRRLQAQAPPRRSPWLPLWQPGLAAAFAAVVVALVAGTAPKPAPIPVAAPRATFVQIARQPDRPSPIHGPVEASAERQIAVAASRQSSSPQPRRVIRRSPASYHRSSPAAPHMGRLVLSTQPHHPSHWNPEARGRRGVGGAPETPVVLADRKEAGADAHRAITVAEVPSPGELPAAPVHVSDSQDTARLVAGDPVKVAESLASAEQDVATDQMKGELLRLAREVARMGGESATAEPAAGPLGESAPSNPSSSSPNAAGT